MLLNGRTRLQNKERGGSRRPVKELRCQNEIWGELRAPEGLNRETRRGVTEFSRIDKR